MDISLTLTAPEVAAALSLSIDHFRHRRPRLEAEGFPRPLPGLPGRWSRAQVAAWIAAGGQAAPAVADGADYVAAQRGYFEAKYAGARP